MDAYKVLNIPPNASPATIKARSGKNLKNILLYRKRITKYRGVLYQTRSRPNYEQEFETEFYNYAAILMPQHGPVMCDWKPDGV